MALKREIELIANDMQLCEDMKIVSMTLISCLYNNSLFDLASIELQL